MSPSPSKNDVPLKRSQQHAVFKHQQAVAKRRPHADLLVSPVPTKAASSNDNDTIPAHGLFLSSASSAGHPDDFLVSPVPSLSRTMPGSGGGKILPAAPFKAAPPAADADSTASAAETDEQMLLCGDGHSDSLLPCNGDSHKDSVVVAAKKDNGKYHALMEERRLSLISPDFQPSLPMFSQRAMAPGAVVPIPTKPTAGATTLTMATNGCDSNNIKLTIWDNPYATSKYFPVRLHRMIEQESQSHGNAIHWSDDGLAFFIDNKEGEPAIGSMGYSSMSSLRRQFNTYGFKKMMDGVHKGYWYHPMFARTSTFDQLLAIKIEKPRSSAGGSKSTGKVVKPKKRVIGKEPRFLVVKNPEKEKEEPETLSKEPSLMVGENFSVGVDTVQAAAPASAGPPVPPFASQFLQPPKCMQEETAPVPFTPPAPPLAWMGLETLADVAAGFSPLFDIKSLESSLGEKPSSPQPSSPLASPNKMSVSSSSFPHYLSHPSPIMTLKTGAFQTTASPFSPLDAQFTPIKRSQQQAEGPIQEDSPVTSAIKFLERKQDAVLTTDTFSTTMEEIKKLCSDQAQV